MKTLQAIVTRVADHRTAKVEVSRSWQHPLYKKYVKRTKSYLVDVPADIQLEVGDEVIIQECVPVSKTKTFRVAAKRQAGETIEETVEAVAAEVEAVAEAEAEAEAEAQEIEVKPTPKKASAKKTAKKSPAKKENKE